jgi:hypothetical protein
MSRNIIELDYDALINSSLDIESFFFCWSKYNNVDIGDYIRKFSDMSERKYLFLIQSGWLNARGSPFTYESVRLNNDRFEDLLGRTTSNDWFEEWYDLWPKGVRSGNYLVRADEVGCKLKLKTFTKKYPKYKPETIIQATKNYINRFSVEGYNFIMTASNFISKNKDSVLAGECEDVLTKKDEGNVIRNVPIQKSLFGENEL